ncbi:hypothetical protein NPIL_574251, partial [Nephila pilipes]
MGDFPTSPANIFE